MIFFGVTDMNIEAETRMERNIAAKEHDFGITRTENGVTSRLSQTGQFLELFAVNYSTKQAPAADRRQVGKIDGERKCFFNAVSKILPGDAIPFSFLAGVLSLPESIADWPDIETFRDVLLSLLSDHGFLFWEVYPTANGQKSVLDFVGLIERDKKGTFRNQELWAETKMIDYLQQNFETQYFRLTQTENMLQSLERNVDQPELFRRCITEVVENVLQRSLEADDASFYENKLIGFCKDKLHLSDEQMCVCVGESGIQQIRSESIGLNSIRGALSVLASECLKLADEVKSQLIKLTLTASEETYRRFKAFKDTYKKLDDELHVSQTIVYSSKLLLTNVKDELVSWYQHVDTIKHDLMKNSAAGHDIPEQIDRQVRINKKSSADTNKTLPKYFDFKWNRLELQEIKKKPYDSIRQNLLQVFKKYWQRSDKGERFVAPDNLEEEINHILVISFMEQFCLQNVHSDDPEEDSVTLGPVIAYLIFRNYRAQIAAGHLERISMHIFFSQAAMQEAPDAIENDFWFFSELCSAYRKFYGKLHIKEVKEQWNAAFLVYSGYQKIYGNFNLLHSIESSIAPDEVPSVHCFTQVMRCIESNRVSLDHSPLSGLNNPNYPPVPKTISPGALIFFRTKLEEDLKNNPKPLLDQYRSFLMHPYSHEGIREFLDVCLERLFQPAEYECICTEFDLYGDRRAVATEALLKAAIEYTMRDMLEEQCAQRLYKWLTDYIDLLYDSIMNQG